MRTGTGLPAVCLSLVLLLHAGNAAAQTRVNESAALHALLQERVAAYVKLRKSLEDGLPPPVTGKDKVDISSRQLELADRIRNARVDAHQGDICSPDVATELRRLISLTMHGVDSARIVRSIRSAERTVAPLAVNGSLPDKLPMPSVPPTLLLNLPRLPPELDYRIAGTALVLRDSMAGVIIDFVPDALPASK